MAGRHINAVNGYTLAEMNVKMYVALPTEDTSDREERELLLGSAVSDSEGRFAIAFGETPLVRQQLCVL